MQYICTIKSTVFLIIYLIYNSLYKYCIDLHLTATSTPLLQMHKRKQCICNKQR